MTLTGSTYLWATSLHTRLDAPMFGYGLELRNGLGQTVSVTK